MPDQLILEKQQQASEILKEKNIDMWMTFVRETGNIKDPMLEMIVGTGATWHSAFIITKEGDTTAVVGSLEEANMKSTGTFKNIVPYLKSVKDDLIKVLNKYNPNKIKVNFADVQDSVEKCLFMSLSEEKYCMACKAYFLLFS